MKPRSAWHLSAALLASVCLIPSANAATTAELEAQLIQMKAMITKLETELTIVKAQQAAQATKVEQVAKQAPKPPSGKDVIMKLKPAPSFETADGSTNFAFDGYIVTDSGFVLHEKNADLEDATDLRFMWLAFKGMIDNVWKYRFQFGLDNQEANIFDAYITYDGFKDTSIMLGNFKENNGIENMSSNINHVFMERSSAMTTFRPQRNIGLSFNPHGENWGGEFGIFGEGPSENEDIEGGEQGYSFTGRIHGAPINTKDQLLHVGGGVRYRVPNSGPQSVRFRNRGESHVIGEYLIDTGTMNHVDSYTTYGAEMRYTYGPAALMAEYTLTDVDRYGGSLDPTFDGGYVSLSYFLTGEQRGYKAALGTYERVPVKSPFSLDEPGTGAWELGARYTFVDLNDKDITGGELNAYTFGLNWYPHNQLKFSLNYIINELDHSANYPDDSPHYLMLRAQLDF